MSKSIHLNHVARALERGMFAFKQKFLWGVTEPVDYHSMGEIGRMIKIDIVKRVADELNLKDREALAVIDTIIESIKETIKGHGRMEIRNFGVFQVKQRKPRTGRNPRNKREYPILPRKVVTFKLGKELKDFSVKEKAQRLGNGFGKSSSATEQPNLFGEDGLPPQR